MRLDRFDLNLLIVLDALLEECNVTRAAERLHIGQSAASGALSRLREYFGDELLVPAGRRLEPTPLARSLVQPVRDTLLRARATLALKPGFEPATAERRFMVCASDYVTTVFLAEAIAALAQTAPGLAIDIRSPPRDVTDAFERGSIDLLVMPEQYVAPLAHPRQALFSDTQVCLLWAGNTAVGASLDFAAYMQLGHVALRLGDESGVAFEEWFLPRGGQPRRIEGSADNFATLPLLLVGTQRVATVHRRLAEHFVRHLPLRAVEAPFEMAAVEETMAWPRYLDADPAHVWLRQHLAVRAAALDLKP